MSHATSPDPLEIRVLLGQLGLNPNEVRVLLALLQRGPCRPSDLATHAEIGRTNIYPLLEILKAKGLADQVPGPSGQWSAVGRDEVVDRLYAAQEERFRALHEAAERARKELAKVVSAEAVGGASCVQRIDTPSQVKVVLNHHLHRARSEVLVFDRPPYAWSPGKPNPVGLEAMERGVKFRELCLASQLADASNEAGRHERATYIAHGMQVRVVDELPMKLVVVDCQVSMVVLLPSDSADNAYPDVLVIDHAGCAETYADSFELRWRTARPYPPIEEGASPSDDVPRKSPSVTPRGVH